MPTVNLAFDRSSVRTVDAFGRMHVERSCISKAVVNPYYGKEIPGFDSLGLEPERVYRLYRDPVELERGAASFARLPILSKHIVHGVDAPQKESVVGAIGSAVRFEAPYLVADLCVWDAPAIAGIETEKIKELSCAYRYVPVMEPGTFAGEPYDGRMTEIQGNHLALVEVGRAGSDVVVADHNPFFKDESAMKMSKVGAALFAALCAASPVLAADSALQGLVGQASRKTTDKGELKGKLIALDASLDSNKLDAVLDAILDVEGNEPVAKLPAPAAADGSPADKLRALLSGKVDDATIEAACALLAPAAADANPEDADKKAAAAMDAFGATLRAELKAGEEARRDVRPVVGEVIGMDSAAEVYGFALDHLKVDRKGVEGVPALRALFKVASAAHAAPAPKIAADSGGLVEQFPNAGRFRHA